MRHLGDAVVMAERALARERQAHQPVQQHRVLRADHVLQRAQFGDARRVTAIQCWGAGRRRWRPAGSGWRRAGSRPSGAQVAPGRCPRRRRRSRRCRPACPCRPGRRWPLTTTSPASNRPAAETTSSGPPGPVRGKWYQADRITLGCTPRPPAASTGVVRVQVVGSRAREPLIPAAAVVPPSVPASLPGAGPPVGVGEVAAGRSITGSAETSDGSRWVGPSAVPAPVRHRRVRRSGQQPGVGSSSTITSSASRRSCRSAPEVGPAHRPRRVPRSCQRQ